MSPHRWHSISGVIEDYTVNYMGYGPIVHHEYTVPIYK